MKKKAVCKLLTLCLCGALAATSVATYAKADTSNTSAGADLQQNITLEVSENPAWNLLSSYVDAEKTMKDETVYVLANADGSAQKIIVSDWLRNADSAAALKDASGLTGIENVKGNETYQETEDGILWNAQGGDVTYQGTSDKALPITVSVSYLLDGKPVTLEELKGQSGHVTIRYAYENHQYETVKVGERSHNLTVPFGVLTGVLLDNNTFANVEVKGGRLVSDGDRTIVAGIAFPGLQENLGIDAAKLEIPASLEIEADVTNFTMGDTVSLVTNSFFQNVNLDRLDSVEDLKDAMNQLSDAMSQLLDGSGQLTDGLNTLLEKSSELTTGVEKLSDGAAQLSTGAKTLDAGAAQLASGATQLSNGLDTITANNDALNGGARQVFDTLLATATQQLNAAGLPVPSLTVENYATVLTNVAASLDQDAIYQTALQTVTEAVNAKREYIRAQVTEAVKAQVTAQVQAQVPEGTPQEMIDAAVAQQMASETVQGLIAQNTEAQVQAAIESAMAGDEVQAKLAAASAGAQSVIGLKQSLDSYNSFYQGVQSYTAGVAQAAAGATQLNAGAQSLKNGTAQLSTGATQLSDGMQSLKSSIPALIDGITQLRDGSTALKDGLEKFDEEGIEKLSDAVNGDLEGLLDRAKATIDAAKLYNNYSGISDDMDGQVKFIYKIAGIE
ncbi:MAG: hypothetical protein II477_08390 [Lachnospiraceae bacterium]|nr:hypothetical protein [Lachnospiraceae bacterium]